MVPSPINNWTEKKQRGQSARKLHCKNMLKILTWLLLKYQFIFLDFQL